MGSGPFLATSPHLLQTRPRCPSDPRAQSLRPRSPGIYRCLLSEQPRQSGPCMVLVVRSRFLGPWGPTARASHTAQSSVLQAKVPALGHGAPTWGPRLGMLLSVPLGVWGVPCAAGLWPMPGTDWGSGQLSPWVTGTRRGQGKAGTTSCPSPCFSAPTWEFWKITQGDGREQQSQFSEMRF